MNDSYFFIIGESQNWFRDLLKFSKIWKLLGSSCSTSKIVPSYEIWVHGLVPEPKNRIRHFQNVDWDKYPLKSKFSKTIGTIEISVERRSGFSIFMQEQLQILVFFAHWSSEFFKIGNHRLLKNRFVYIKILLFIFSI